MKNYILCNEFLFTSNSCTSINFVESNKLSVYEDLNKRVMVVKYVSGMKYRDLVPYIPNFTSYTDNEIKSDLYVLREFASTKINGVTYYVNNEFDFLSCFICKGHNEILVSNKAINIITDGSLVSYKNLINSSNIIKTENLELLDIVANFQCVNLNLPFNREFNDTYLHKYQEFSINDSMIVSAFVDAMRDYLPNYTIAPELNKEFIKDQKQNIIIYEAKLTEHGDGYSTHVRSSPDLGRYAQTETEVSIEILSDDFSTYMNTRDKLLMNLHLFQLTNFKLTDIYGREWGYACNWSMNELGSEIDRSPKSKYFDETILYSIQLTVRLVGWLVEKFNLHAARISDPVILRYVKDYSNGLRIDKEFKISGDIYDIELSVGSLIDLSQTDIYYSINNVTYVGVIDKFNKKFTISTDCGVKYTGIIDQLSGEFIFDKRYNKTKYKLNECGDKLLDDQNNPIDLNNLDPIPMQEGKVTIRTKQLIKFQTTYSIVAEIIPDNNVYLISNLEKFITTSDNKKIIVYCKIDYMDAEFRYVYYSYMNGYHIFSINSELLDNIKSNFENLNKENGTIIISSKNKVLGYKSEFNKELGNIGWSSGNTKFVNNYLDYNLYNYINNKFIKIKELIYEHRITKNN